MAKKTKTKSASKKKQDYKSKDYKKAYERASEVASDAAYTYMPYVANTVANFRQTIGDIDAWLRSSTPFRKSSGGRGVSPTERRISSIGSTLFEGLKKDVKEKRFVGFKHLNESIEELINGMHETGFDDNYDAEADDSDNYDSNVSAGSFDGLDADTYIEGQAVNAQVTVDAMSMATDALTNAQFSASDYSAKRIVAGTNSAISHVLKYQAASADILNTINQNLGSIIDQNSKIDSFHSQALDFFERTETTLNEMIDLMREQADPVEARSMQSYGKNDTDSDFITGGFDPGKYIKHVWNNSSVGMGAQMALSSIAPYLKAVGIDVSKLITSVGTGPAEAVSPLKSLFEKTPLFRQLENINTQVEDLTRILFQRLNNNENFTNNDDLNKILRMMASVGLFGGDSVKRGNAGSLRLDNYDKGVARVTGKTLKSIEMVIPNYLSNIENDINALLTGFSSGAFVVGTFQDKSKTDKDIKRAHKSIKSKINRDYQRYYDYEEGTFVSKRDMIQELQDQEDSTMEAYFSGTAKNMRAYIGDAIRNDPQRAKALNNYIAKYGNGSVFEHEKEAKDELLQLLYDMGYDKSKFADEQSAFDAAENIFLEFEKAAQSYAMAKKARNERIPGSVLENYYNDQSKKKKPRIEDLRGRIYNKFSGIEGYDFSSTVSDEFTKMQAQINYAMRENPGNPDIAAANIQFNELMKLYEEYKSSPDTVAGKQKRAVYIKKRNKFIEKYPQFSNFDDMEDNEVISNYASTGKGIFGIEMPTGSILNSLIRPFKRFVFSEFGKDSYDDYDSSSANSGNGPSTNPSDGSGNVDESQDGTNTNSRKNTFGNAAANVKSTVTSIANSAISSAENAISNAADNISNIVAAGTNIAHAVGGAIPAASVDTTYDAEKQTDETPTSIIDNTPVHEMRTSQSAELNLKNQTNERIKRAKTYGSQFKEMLLEITTNIRSLTGNAEYQRLRLFGSDGVLPKIWRFATTLLPMAKRFLFGDKDENGYYKGGLFGPTLANKAIDAKKFVKYKLFGKGYTNYKQETFADSDDYLLKPVQEGVDTFKNNLYSSTMGSDFANSNVYKALPNALKRRDDRRITLKSAATNEVGEDGIAKDTYDYSKWKVLPKSKAKIHGWVWNSDTNTWEMEYEYGGAVQRSRPDGFDLNDPAQLPLPPATEAILNAINGLAPDTGSHEGGTTSGTAPQKIGDVLKDDTAVDSEDVADDVKSKVATTVNSFFGNKSKGSKTKSIIGGVVGFMVGGSIPGALIGAAIGSGALSKPASALHKTIFGDYKRKESTTFAGKILNTASLGLKKVANFGLTILGATVGFMAGGPVGALVGGSIGHGAFKQGGLKNALFGGKDKDGYNQKGVVPSAAGSAFGGIGKLFKSFNDKTKGSGVIAPLLGATMGAAFGIPGVLLGGMAGKAVGSGVNKIKDWATINAGTNPDKVFNNDSLTDIEEEAQEAQVSMPDIVQDSTDDIIEAINATTAAVKSTQGDSTQKSSDDDASTEVDEIFNSGTSEDYSEVGPEDRKESPLSSEWQSAVDNIFNSGTSYAYDEYDAEDDEYVGSGPGDAHLKTEAEAQKAQIEVPDLIEKASDDIVFAIHSEFETDRKERVKRRQRNKEAEENEFSMARGKRDEKEKSTSASYDGTDNEEDEPKEESFLSKLFGSFSKIGTIAKLAVGGIIGAGLISKIMNSPAGEWIKEKIGGVFNTATKWVGDILKNAGNLIGNAIKNIDWSTVVNTVGDVFGGIGNGIATIVDTAAGNKTNFSNYDDNGNYNGNFLDNLTGTTYETITDPETGETTVVSNGPDMSKSTIGDSLSRTGNIVAAQLITNQQFRNKMANWALKAANKAATNIYTHSFVTGSVAFVKTGISTPRKLAWNILNFARSFIDTVIQKAIALASNFPSTKVGQALTKVATSAKDKLSKWFNSTKLSQYITQNSEKISEAVAKITAGGVIQAVSVGAFVAYGLASGGAWGCNDLFGITENDLNATNTKLDIPLMRSISGIFEALIDSNIPGSIFALANDIIYTIFGVSAKRELATGIYNAIESLKGEAGEDAIRALENSQTTYKARLSLYNDATGNSLSIAEYQEATELSDWEMFAKNLPSWMQSKKLKKKLATREEIISQTNYAEAAAISEQARAGTYSTDDFYQNMSVEDMSADSSSGTSEGYGNSSSVGYGTSNSTHFSQLDKTWRDVAFGKMRSGKTTTIGTGGCGPTALANVARSLTGNRSITPTTVANMAQDYGYTANGGSAASLFTEGANRLGLSSQRISTKDIPSRLAAGQKIIVSGKKQGSKSPYTSAGHIISLSGVKNGKAVVDDPLKSNTETKNIGDVMSGAKKAWVIGNGSVGYGTLDDYISNLESMGYGFDADGNLLEINDENFKNHLINGYPVNTGTTYPDGVFFQQGSWGTGYSSESAKAWANKSFGSSNYADSGCFPTAFANVFSSLTKMDIDPMLVIDAFSSHWNGANYQWNGYSDMLKLLYDTATIAHEDELLDAGFISTHTGNQYVPTGWDGLSNEEKINEAMLRVGRTLRNGGGVWIDAFNDANVFSGKSHPGGHAIAMYGCDWGESANYENRAEPGTLYDRGEGDGTTTILDPGRSYSSGYGVVKFPLTNLRSDLVNGRIKRITTFPYVDESRKYEGISSTFEKFKSNYSTRGSGGDAVTGSRSSGTDYAYDSNGNQIYEAWRNTSNPITTSLVSGSNSTSISDPFSIYKYQNELDVGDTSLMGKISNLGTILSKIAMNMFNTLDGSAYESVFSGSLGSNGSSGMVTLGLDDYTYGDDSVAGVNGVPQYIMIRNPRTGSLAYLDVANIDINDDESLTKHAQSVLASWYDDYDGTKHSEQLSGIKNQIKNAIKNNEYANGKYLKVETPDGQTRYVPSWITRENAVIQLKDAIKQDGYYVGDDDAIIAAWEDAKAKLSRTGYFTRDGSTFAEADVLNGINKNEYKTVSVIPSYATSAGPGSTYPEYATTASGLTPYRQQSRTVSSKLSDSVLDSMADYIIPMQHAHESGTDYGKVAHLTWNNEPYLTVGTGWYAENGAEVLGRISKAPELSEDKRMLAASYAAKLLKIPEAGLKDSVENFLRQSDVASVNKNVQLAMQREYNRDIYMKTPIAYYDNGTLKDPRSIMQLAEFAGIAPNATSHYAYLGTDSASTDLARTRDVLLNRWTKYTGWQNRIKDDYDLLTNVYNNHTYTSWQTGDTYDDFPSNVRQTINNALGDSVGYGDLNISDFDSDDTMSRMLGKSMGFGNPYTTNNNTRNSMSFASTRRYSPTANISADDNSTTNTNVNVNLSHIENGTDRMIALLERIVTNTGIKQPVAGNTTIINNNHESTGYGNADTQKSNTNVAVNRDEKINNVKKDRFRKMHDMVAKSPRATVR